MYLYGFPLRSIMSRLFRLSTSVPFSHVSSGWLSMIFKTSSLYGMCDVSTTARNSSHATPLSTQTISESVADRLQGILCRVVEEGTGRAASQVPGGAAGKTGTAQTGRYTEDETEIMDLWFAGWYPAEDPDYTILVLQDTATNTPYSCTEIFAQVCQALYWLENS